MGLPHPGSNPGTAYVFVAAVQSQFNGRRESDAIHVYEARESNARARVEESRRKESQIAEQGLPCRAKDLSTGANQVSPLQRRARYFYSKPIAYFV